MLISLHYLFLFFLKEGQEQPTHYSAVERTVEGTRGNGAGAGAAAYKVPVEIAAYSACCYAYNSKEIFFNEFLHS